MNVKLKLGFNQVQFTVDAVTVPTPVRGMITRQGHTTFAQDGILDEVMIGNALAALNSIRAAGF